MTKRYLILLVIINIVLIIINIFIWKDDSNTETLVTEGATQKLYTSSDGVADLEKVWCGSFQLAWNELMDYAGGEIEFIGEETSSETLENLNKQNFTKDMISEENYYIKVEEKPTPSLKDDILKDLENKFGNKDSKILDNLSFENINGIAIYTMIQKQFEFLKEFDKLKEGIFFENNDSTTKVRYFGIDDESKKSLYDNVEIMYYDEKSAWEINEFAVKLKTKENDEIILYRTDKTDSFEKLYQDVLELDKSYEGSEEFSGYDVLKIPYINLNFDISYDELCGKEIKNLNGEYIDTAVQNITFSLNPKGGFLQSEAAIITDSMSAPATMARLFNYTRPFIMFIKEKEAEKPYFAVRINNTEFLEIAE